MSTFLKTRTQKKGSTAHPMMETSNLICLSPRTQKISFNGESREQARLAIAP